MDPYKTPEDALNDPAFRSSKPETQRWALKQIDPKGWGSKNDQEIDAFITRVKPAWEREDQKAKAVTQQMQQMPPLSPELPKKSMYQKAVAPVTEAVGRGMEMVTDPLVRGARLAQGEGMQALTTPNPVGAGGIAGESRRSMAAGVVPQSPWQAGAMGAQLIPGVGAAGAIPRVAGSMVGAGALQGLLGEKGLVEGGGVSGAAGEAARGLLKGGATQAAGETLGKLTSGAQMITPGASRRAGEKDFNSVQKTVGEIAPELQPAQAGQQAGGAYYTGTKGAKLDAGAEFKNKLTALEGELNAAQGHPYIAAPELVGAYRQLVRQMGKDPVLGPQLANLAPSPQGFLPEQAAKIVSLTGQRLGANQTGLGHMKDAAMDDLVAAIERSLPSGAQGMLSGARSGYARSSGLQELLEPAFKPGKGYTFDIKELQKRLSTDPDFIARLGKGELEKLFTAVTRGASKGPGFADKPAGNVSVPYPSKTGAAVAALRNFLTHGRTIGKHPLSLEEGTKAGLGVATTGAVSSRTKNED